MTNDLVDALIAQIEILRDSIRTAKQEVEQWEKDGIVPTSRPKPSGRTL